MIYGHSTDHKRGKVVGTSCKRQYSPQFTAFTHNNDEIFKNVIKNEQLHHFYSRYYNASGSNVKCMVNQIRSVLAIEHLNI